MSFDDWWKENEDRLFIKTGRGIALEVWQAAQQAERERTTAIILKHLASWEMPWSEKIDKMSKEINELGA